MMGFHQWSKRSLLLVGLFCIVFGSLMLIAVVIVKPWIKTSQIVPERIRSSITPIETKEKPTTSGDVGEIGIEEKQSEGSIPEEEKPIVPKSPGPSMMIPGKGIDEKVVVVHGAKSPNTGKITQILVDKRKEVISVTLIGDRKIGDYNCFKLKKPPCLVIDIWNVEKQYPKSHIRVDHPLLKGVRLEKHPKKTRFVFESAWPQVPMFRVRRAGNRLIVSFGQVFPLQ